MHALGQVLMLGLATESSYLWTLPMFHVNGWGHMWACVAIGCTQVVPPPMSWEDVGDLISFVKRHRISHFAGAPRLLRAMIGTLDDENHSLSGVTVVTGGSPPPPVLILKLEQAGARVIHQYGLNETCGPFVVCEPQADWAQLPPEERAALSVRQGLPAIHAGNGVAVLNADGAPVPWDGRSLGEVTMTGNTLAMGYYKNKEATEQAFRNGRFFSGDVAVVHPDGYLEIRDRIKDLIYVETEYGWENIPSAEIENVLTRHPAIADAGVVSVAHPRSLDKSPRLIAFVECRPGAEVSASEVLSYCAKELTLYKRPHRIFFSQLQKTNSGKVRKDALVKEAQARLEDWPQESAPPKEAALALGQAASN